MAVDVDAQIAGVDNMECICFVSGKNIDTLKRIAGTTVPKKVLDFFYNKSVEITCKDLHWDHVKGVVFAANSSPTTVALKLHFADRDNARIIEHYMRNVIKRNGVDIVFTFK